MTTLHFFIVYLDTSMPAIVVAIAMLPMYQMHCPDIDFHVGLKYTYEIAT